MAKPRRKRSSGRKTFKKKTTAKRAGKKSGRSPYKVKGGWRLGKR
jgi:hypothetical protein